MEEISLKREEKPILKMFRLILFLSEKCKNSISMHVKIFKTKWSCTQTTEVEKISVCGHGKEKLHEMSMYNCFSVLAE